MRHSFVTVGLVGLLIGLLVVSFVAHTEASAEFARVCAESGGRAVWDGGRNHCITPYWAEGKR